MMLLLILATAVCATLDQRTNCRPTFSGASWMACGWRATAQPWRCGPTFGDCVHWNCVPCWRGSMHASTGNELRRCISPSWQQRLSPRVADHVPACVFAIMAPAQWPFCSWVWRSSPRNQSYRMFRFELAAEHTRCSLVSITLVCMVVAKRAGHTVSIWELRISQADNPVLWEAVLMLFLVRCTLPWA